MNNCREEYNSEQVEFHRKLEENLGKGKEASNMFEEWKKDGHDPDFKSYQLLIEALILAEEPTLAIKYLKQLVIFSHDFLVFFFFFFFTEICWFKTQMDSFFSSITREYLMEKIDILAKISKRKKKFNQLNKLEELEKRGKLVGIVEKQKMIGQKQRKPKGRYASKGRRYAIWEPEDWSLTIKELSHLTGRMVFRLNKLKNRAAMRTHKKKASRNAAAKWNAAKRAAAKRAAAK